MKILLVGEYSRLHNSLKEGLTALGHQVTLISDGDGFKNFPNDLSIRAKYPDKPVLKLFTKVIYKLFNLNLFELERGIRFIKHLKKLKNYDVVQLINERPVKTTSGLEKYILKKLFLNNERVFLLSCGVDHINVQYMLDKKLRYSLLDSYFENPLLKKEFEYVLEYTSESSKQIHNLVFDNVVGIIASDIDYVLPLKGHPKYLGLIPNPINTDKINFKPSEVEKQVVIFLGINPWNYYPKGVEFFEKAIEIIQKKYAEKLKVIVAKGIPYKEYLALYGEAHILLDQVYSYDQGYNALEAMASGKVVFTGAESEFLRHFNLQADEVCINALPDVDYLVEKLSFLIENPNKITEIGLRARTFIEQEHHYKVIAGKYLEIYTS